MTFAKSSISDGVATLTFRGVQIGATDDKNDSKTTPSYLPDSDDSNGMIKSSFQ